MVATQEPRACSEDGQEFSVQLLLNYSLALTAIPTKRVLTSFLIFFALFSYFILGQDWLGTQGFGCFSGSSDSQHLRSGFVLCRSC